MTPAPDTGRTAEEMAAYVLIKRGLYWRPNAMGYTGVLAEAGLYTEADARARADGDGTTMQLASEATEFAPACWQETKIAVLSQQVAHLRAENANLRDRVREAEKGAEAMRGACLKAAISASYGPPSSWPGPYPKGWKHPPCWGPGQKPTPDQAAWHDNGARDAWFAIRALPVTEPKEKGEGSAA